MNDDLPLFIPEEVGAPIELFHKRAGEACPHLVSQGGRLTCGVHAAKETYPQFDVCREWRGSVSEVPWAGMDNYTVLINQFWMLLRLGFSLEVANRMVEKGIVNRRPSAPYSQTDYYKILDRAFRMDTLPIALLDLMGISVRNLSPENRSKLGLSQNNQNPIIQQFLTRYSGN